MAHQEVCLGCRGRKVVNCPECKGTGRVRSSYFTIDGTMRCPTCEGSGKVWCPDCDGKGFVILPDY
jgi:DnaJ-class molecular chaperone